MAGSPGNTGIYGSGVKTAKPTPKKVYTGTPLKPGKPAHPHADPGQLKKSYDAYVKAHPSGSDKWAKFFKSKGPATPSDTSAWDPLAGMPGMTELTPFPQMDGSLPDGSRVGPDPSHPFTPGKASVLDPNKWADLMGRKSYQPIIDALQSRVGGLQSGVGQANDMLDKSFGSAATEAQAGAQRILQGTQKSNLSLTDLAARMAQAAGGDPLAAAAVGQATANQQGADTAQANVAAQAQSDQAAAAQRDLGTAKLAYKGATDSSITDLISKIGATKTEGSQAQGKAIMDALGFNSDQKTAQQGRDTSAQEAWLAGQLAGPEITAKRLQNESTRAGLKLQKHQSDVSDWTALNSATRQSYMDKVTKWTNKNVANQMKDALAAGKQPKAELALADPQAYAAAKMDIIGSSLSKNGPLVDPGKIYTTALTRMKEMYGDSQPLAIKKLAQLFAQEQINSWNSHHADAQDNSGKTWKMVNGAPALVKR